LRNEFRWAGIARGLTGGAEIARVGINYKFQ
jgi:hypothetical protein